MATIATDMIGGPCDGTTGHFTVAELATGAVNCLGATYVVQGITPTHYRATWAQLAEHAGPGPGLANPADFNRAWTGLMHTLAHKVPAQLQRQQAALQRIRRAVR